MERIHVDVCRKFIRFFVCDLCTANLVPDDNAKLWKLLRITAQNLR